MEKKIKRLRDLTFGIGLLTILTGLFTAIWGVSIFDDGLLGPRAKESMFGYMFGPALIVLSGALTAAFGFHYENISKRDWLAFLSGGVAFFSTVYVGMCFILVFEGGGPVNSFGHYYYHAMEHHSPGIITHHWVEGKVGLHLISVSLISLVIVGLNAFVTLGRTVRLNAKEEVPDQGQSRIERFQEELKVLRSKEKLTEQDVMLAKSYQGHISKFWFFDFIVSYSLLVLFSVGVIAGAAYFIIPESFEDLLKDMGLFLVPFMLPFIGLMGTEGATPSKMNANWKLQQRVALAFFIIFVVMSVLVVSMIFHSAFAGGYIYKGFVYSVAASLAGKVELAQKWWDVSWYVLLGFLSMFLTWSFIAASGAAIATLIRRSDFIAEMNYRYLSQK